MKIKTKKQLNLPQLIEWIEINRRFDESFGSDRYNYVHANIDGILEFTGNFCEDTFTVEVEEEIDEETKLGLLLDHFINPYGQHYVGNIYQNRSINDVLEENDEMEISTNSIHLFDKETKEFILIWRDGKMVE